MLRDTHGKIHTMTALLRLTGPAHNFFHNIGGLEFRNLAIFGLIILIKTDCHSDLHRADSHNENQ